MDELEMLEMRRSILKYIQQHNFAGLLLLIEEIFTGEAELFQAYSDNIKRIREGLG